MTTKLFVVDDQLIVRKGLETLIGYIDDIDIIGEAESGEEALIAIPEQQPDVILLDIRMPKLNGIEVLVKLKELGITTPVIMLTTFDDHRLILEAVKAGAKGYLLKDSDIEELVEAIKCVVDGGAAITPLSKCHYESSESLSNLPNPPEFIEPLTKKEMEILRLIVSGLSNKEISEALFKSEGTIKNHITHLMAKLGVRDRTQTVLYAISHKLV